MDLQFVISPQEAGSALQVEIADTRATVTGLASGRRIVFEGVFSNVTVKVAPEAAPVEDQPVPVSPVLPEVAPDQPVSPEPVAVVQDTEQLFGQLVALRKKISSEVKMPPFIIFQDSTLRDMCRKLPVDLETMGTVSGVGEAKLAKFGARFIEVIREYLQGKEG
ncbi:MAG: HRDC domain-containing protein [Bacteroidota bacterium]